MNLLSMHSVIAKDLGLVHYQNESVSSKIFEQLSIYQIEPLLLINRVALELPEFIKGSSFLPYSLTKLLF